jgi:hypothetical protein
MPNYLESDFCSPDEGLDFLFSYMAAVYGASFVRHWDGVESGVIRQVWREQLGRFVTYRPSMEYALAHLPANFPPSAIAFRNLCNGGPRIPDKPNTLLANQSLSTKTTPEVRERELAAIRAFLKRHKCHAPQFEPPPKGE